MRDECWYCGGKLIWQNDFSWDDVHCDGGEGIVTYLVCSKCGAMVEYSIRDEDGNEEEICRTEDGNDKV